MEMKEKSDYSGDYGTTQETLRREISNNHEIFNHLAKFKRLPLILILAVALTGSWAVFKGGLREGAVEISGSQPITMTKVSAVVGKGLVEVPLDLVKNNKLVSFDYNRTDGPIPLLAYMTPSGKIITAVGISEPCHSKSFHLEGNEIVCDVCSTRWNLETLAGNNGECAANPLEMLSHTVHEGRVIIKEMDVQNWKPKVVRG